MVILNKAIILTNKKFSILDIEGVQVELYCTYQDICTEENNIFINIIQTLFDLNKNINQLDTKDLGSIYKHLVKAQ